MFKKIWNWITASPKVVEVMPFDVDPPLALYWPTESATTVLYRTDEPVTADSSRDELLGTLKALAEVKTEVKTNVSIEKPKLAPTTKAVAKIAPKTAKKKPAKKK